MDVDTVWRSGASDLPEAKATIESIKILFPPATASPSHLLQQLHITIGHASPLPFLVFSSLRKEAATMIHRARCPFRQSCASALLLGAPGSSPAPEATLEGGDPRDNPGELAVDV